MEMESVRRHYETEPIIFEVLTVEHGVIQKTKTVVTFLQKPHFDTSLNEVTENVTNLKINDEKLMDYDSN